MRSVNNLALMHALDRSCPNSSKRESAGKTRSNMSFSTSPAWRRLIPLPTAHSPQMFLPTRSRSPLRDISLNRQATVPSKLAKQVCGFMHACLHAQTRRNYPQIPRSSSATITEQASTSRPVGSKARRSLSMQFLETLREEPGLIDQHRSIPHSYDELPTEVLLIIISMLPAEGIAALGLTCKRMFQVCMSSDLWQSLFQTVFSLRTPPGQGVSGADRQAAMPLNWSSELKKLSRCVIVSPVLRRGPHRRCETICVVPTITEAIRLNKGDASRTIVVAPGHYNEHLVVSSSVRIIGANMREDALVVVNHDKQTTLSCLHNECIAAFENIAFETSCEQGMNENVHSSSRICQIRAANLLCQHF